jgi:hypothetical protein
MYLAMEAHLDGYKVGLCPPDGSLTLESPVARGDEKLLQETLNVTHTYCLLHSLLCKLRLVLRILSPLTAFFSLKWL